jgi:hypothetical protein
VHEAGVALAVLLSDENLVLEVEVGDVVLEVHVL